MESQVQLKWNTPVFTVIPPRILGGNKIHLSRPVYLVTNLVGYQTSKFLLEKTNYCLLHLHLLLFPFTHLQVWMCGGSMEVLPCSRVAHIARTKKPYHNNIALHTRRNALRVAEVWMDEFKSNVYLAWNIPMEVEWRQRGRIQCIIRC